MPTNDEYITLEEAAKLLPGPPTPSMVTINRWTREGKPWCGQHIKLASVPVGNRQKRTTAAWVQEFINALAAVPPKAPGRPRPKPKTPDEMAQHHAEIRKRREAREQAHNEVRRAHCLKLINTPGRAKPTHK